MADEKPTFNPNREFAAIRGDPRVRNLQDGNYFDLRGDFVKVAPASFQPRLEKVAPPPTVDEAEEETLRRARLVIGEAPVVPDSVQTAAKENLEALAAESNADTD